MVEIHGSTAESDSTAVHAGHGSELIEHLGVIAASESAPSADA